MSKVPAKPNLHSQTAVTYISSFNTNYSVSLFELHHQLFWVACFSQTYVALSKTTMPLLLN